MLLAHAKLTKVDTTAQRLQHLDIPRRRTAIVAIVQGRDGALGNGGRAAAGRAGGHLGDAGHDVVDVKVENARVGIDRRVRRRLGVQEDRVVLHIDDRLGELVNGREGVLVRAAMGLGLVTATVGMWALLRDVAGVVSHQRLSTATLRAWLTSCNGALWLG